MLLADQAQTADEMGKWVGPVLATLGAAVAALFSWLSSRDKLKFDAGVVELRGAVAILTEKTKECHEERDEWRTKYDALQDRFDALQAQQQILKGRVDDRSDQYPRVRPEEPHS